MQTEARGLTKVISGNTVLDNIFCEIKSGNIYGIAGKNGSGKTMLMRAIAGLIHPTSGRITVDGKELCHDISFPPNMGLIIEKPELLNYLSGFENLKLIAEIKQIVTDEEISEFMRLFSLSAESKQKVKKYSLGMKQKSASSGRLWKIRRF